MPGENWAILLAAGDGTRLRTVATDERGICTPKQFLTFGRSRSLLRTTFDRARTVAAPHRIVTVTAAAHEPWWRREMQSGPLGTVLAQPRNAGTAPGLLLPLLAILQQDPDAVALSLPSDHHVHDEERFAAALRQLVAAARADSGKLVLLGMEPDGPEVQYGWIVPAEPSAGLAREVVAFVEKPAPEEAVVLLSRGALWSTFVMAASARALLGAFLRATPALATRFMAEAAHHARFATDPQRLRVLYDGLPTTDFSGAILQDAACRDMLRTLPVPNCGWTDLGTPERVARAFPDVPWASPAAHACIPARPAPDPPRAMPVTTRG